MSSPVARLPSAVRPDTTVIEFLSPLSRMLDDKQVNEICINSPGAAFVERSGVGSASKSLSSRSSTAAASRPPLQPSRVNTPANRTRC